VSVSNGAGISISAGPEVPDEPRDDLAVERVLRILPPRDGLRELGAALEEEDEEDGAGQGDVEKLPGGGDGEEVEDEPEELLREVVWVAADGEQAPGNKPNTVRVDSSLLTVELAIFLVLEVLLLVVSQGLKYHEYQEGEGDHEVQTVEAG